MVATPFAKPPLIGLPFQSPQFRFATCYNLLFGLLNCLRDCLRDYPSSAIRKICCRSSLHLTSQSPIRLRRHGATPGTLCFQDSCWEALPSTCLGKSSRHFLPERKESPTCKRLLKPSSDASYLTTFSSIHLVKPLADTVPSCHWRFLSLLATTSFASHHCLLQPLADRDFLHGASRVTRGATHLASVWNYRLLTYQLRFYEGFIKVY